MDERARPAVARAPQMGWMSWNTFGRELDEVR
jgi:hypothetical protein